MWKTLLIGATAAIAAAALVVMIANTRFDRAIDRRIGEMFAGRQPDSGRVVTEEDLSGLPDPISRWLRWSGVIGRPYPETVRLQQEGRFRMAPDQRWAPIVADQYYTLAPPELIWRVRMTMFPGLFVRGVDSLEGGRGRITIKLMGLFPIADMRGEAFDQGVLLRYLQEIVWFPFAALGESITWEVIDDTSARAVLHADDLDVEGVFHIDAQGQVTEFSAIRYADEKPEPVLRPWRVPMSDYGTFDGIRVPTHGLGIWVREDGEFVYADLTITDIGFDVPAVYGR